MQIPPGARKARVVATGATLALQGADGFSSPPVVRPFVGGVASGLHTMPQVGDQVLIIQEQDNHAAGAIAQTDAPASLPALLAGETGIYHPNGSFLKFPNSGPVTLWSNGGGTLKVQVDPATGRVNITAAGGIWCNGVQITVP